MYCVVVYVYVQPCDDYDLAILCQLSGNAFLHFPDTSDPCTQSYIHIMLLDPELTIINIISCVGRASIHMYIMCIIL